jgi:hypothetical protein
MLFNKFGRSLGATCLFLTISSPTSALEYFGDLTAGLALTDNVELAPSGQEQSEGILRVAPTLNLYHESKRIDFIFEGTLEGLFYRDDSDRNQANTELFSSLLVDVIDERLGWRGLASLAQVNIDPDGPTTNTNLFDTGNRDDALFWETGPEWTSPIFSQGELMALGYAGQVNYGDSDIQDIDTQYAEVAITQSPGAVGSLGYEARYIFQRFDYDESGDLEDQSAYLRLSYQYTQSLRLFGLVGADNDFEDQGSSALDEFRWETGFATEIGSADTFEAAIGERFYGTTWRAAWNRIRENQRYRIQYSEEPANADLLQREALRRGEDPDGLDPADDEAGRPGVDDRYIRDRLDLIAEFEFARSFLSIEGYWEKQNRENSNLVNDEFVGSLTGDETFWGVESGFTWQVGDRTAANLAFFYRNRDSDRFNPDGTSAGSTEDDLYRFSAGLDYILGVKTSVSLTVRYDNRDGSGGDDDEYDQFGGILEIKRSFGDLQLQQR